MPPRAEGRDPKAHCLPLRAEGRELGPAPKGRGREPAAHCMPLRAKRREVGYSLSPREQRGQQHAGLQLPCRRLCSAMNCSQESGLRALLTRLLQELNKANVSLGALPGEEERLEEQSKRSESAYLYILLIMIFYACLAGGLILAYTRSRKQESKSDPYHLYIEREWGRGSKEHGEEQERPVAESQQLL